jgi:UPF0716 protein FxsA
VPLLAFVVFVVFPAVEIFVIVQMVHWIGGLATLVLLVAGAFLGMVVMRRAGASWWRALVGRTRTPSGVEVSGQTPDPGAAASAALLFVAGLLLFLPGFISDVFGLILLLPPVRGLLLSATSAWFLRRFTAVDAPGGIRIWTRQQGGIRGDGRGNVGRGGSGTVVRGTVVRTDQIKTDDAAGQAGSSDAPGQPGPDVPPTPLPPGH